MKKRLISIGLFALVAIGVVMTAVTEQSVVAVAADATKMETCAYHGLPLDSCTRCNPDLISKFKANDNWCEEHKLPESQCYLCNPDLKPASSATKSSSAKLTVQNEVGAAKQTKANTVDWCAEHRVPESECTKCNPNQIESFKAKHDWCGGHNVPESHCYLCNPGLKFAQEGEYNTQNESSATIDWCSEHRVPESECTKCHPELIDAFKANQDWCGGHNVPESHCYQCNSGLKFPQEADYERSNSKKEQSNAPKTSLYRNNRAQCATDNAVIQFASIQTAARAGLEFLPVDEVPLSETIDLPGEVEFDALQSATVTSPISGVLARWAVNPGERVQRGQVLAYLESMEGAEKIADYVHAQAMYTLATKNFDRKQSLTQGGMASAREKEEAEAEYLRSKADLKRAESVLRMLGFTDNNLVKLTEDDYEDGIIPLRARRSGKLVEQLVSLGAVLTDGYPIGLISETEKMWVEAQAPEASTTRIRAGQAVEIRNDANGAISAKGKVVWVADGVDENTRMGKVRIEIEPNGTQLRAHQFVRAVVELAPEDNTVVIPSEAVQWEGCCNVVFVQETPDRIRPRKIKVLYADRSNYAVTGVHTGERIAVRGSYMLKTELMKSSIGVGCCGEGA
jgi:cobalt-zinc-cadmium efflux system membrane fusion protein